MFRLHLLHALRFIFRNKLFSIINILGLALGLAAGTYILMFIINEFSFDRFNKDLENIYRVTWRWDQTDVSEEVCVTTAGVGPSLIDEFPEVKMMARFSHPSSGYLQYNDKSYSINGISYADSSFFRIFSYKLTRGHKDDILRNPHEIVLSESTAKKIFGEEDPVGRTLRLDNEHNLIVTGIFEDVPTNSHLIFDALASFSTLYKYDDIFLGWDGGHNYYTYVLLTENTDLEQLKKRFPDFMEQHLNYKYHEIGLKVSLSFQPLKDIHLHSVYNDDVDTRGSINDILILSSIALVILLMACINFINLSTARALKRAREIGIRKVMGASRNVLIRQFLLESTLYILIAFILSLLLVDLFQPWFNQLIGKDFQFFSTSNGILFTVLPVLLVLMILLAGGYPAFYLSRFLPMVVMKGASDRGYSRSYLRNGLVVFQFFITAALVAAGFTVYYQLEYLSNRSTGYHKEGVVVIPLASSEVRGKYTLLREGMLTIPGIVSAAGSSDVPGFDFTRNGYFPEGFKEPLMINVLDIDPAYLQTMGIQLVGGRNFERGSALDSNAYIVNEALIRKLNWDDALGKMIMRNGKHPVIGVTSDFNFASLHKEISPLILTMVPWQGFSFLSIRYEAEDFSGLISQMGETWSALEKTEPFDFFLLEEYLGQAYAGEENFGKMVGSFGIIAIIIACLGLLGLSSYMTEQRRKEVGIRKVLGASPGRILTGYAAGFLKLVLVANILSIPLVWALMNRWLENFAYRAGLPWSVFLMAFLLSVGIALVTISIQVWRASRANPVEALRAE